MNTALLNVRITIEENAVSIDEIGNHINEWTDYYSCAATVSGESGSEVEKAGTTIDNPKVDFTIRWCRKASPITSDSFRVRFKEEIYDIIGIDHMNFKKKALKLKCQKERQKV